MTEIERIEEELTRKVGSIIREHCEAESVHLTEMSRRIGKGENYLGKVVRGVLLGDKALRYVDQHIELGDDVLSLAKERADLVGAERARKISKAKRLRDLRGDCSSYPFPLTVRKFKRNPPVYNWRAA